MKLSNVQRRAIYRFYREEMGYTAKEAANARNRPYKVFSDWRFEHGRIKSLNRRYRAERKPLIPQIKKPEVKLTKPQRASVRKQLKIAGVPAKFVTLWSRRSEAGFLVQKARFDGLTARLRYEGKDVKDFMRDLEKRTRTAEDDAAFWDRFQDWYMEKVGVRLTAPWKD